MKRGLRWAAGGAYALLWLASQVWVAARPELLPSAPAGSERLLLAGGVSALRWQPEGARRGADADPLPVLLLHGSPGSAENLASLARRLAEDGREVLALDLPGFGASARAPGGRSILAHAASALAAAPWPRFHVAGWSMGGGAALHMADLDPARVSSVALVASIGVQEAEGSGSYHVEHFKYALMWALAVPGAELAPHFGALGSRAERSGFCANFRQTDQRPLRRILASLATPLLVVHGRRDFLVPAWCAEESHALARASRLALLEGSHFLPFEPPFGQLDRLAPELAAFFARHDGIAVPEPRTRYDDPPAEVDRRPEPHWLQRRAPWWLLLASAAALAAGRPLASGLAVGGLGALLQLDVGLGLCGALFGALFRSARSAPRRWRRLGLDLLAILGGALAGAAAAGALAPSCCRIAGPLAGALLALALPLGLAELCRAWLARRRRAGAPSAGAA